MIGTKCWYYKNAESVGDGLYRVSVNSNRLNFEDYFIQFTESEEDLHFENILYSIGLRLDITIHNFLARRSRLSLDLRWEETNRIKSNGFASMSTPLSYNRSLSCTRRFAGKSRFTKKSLIETSSTSLRPLFCFLSWLDLRLGETSSSEVNRMSNQEAIPAI